jgi:hypothetical protein
MYKSIHFNFITQQNDYQTMYKIYNLLISKKIVSYISKSLRPKMGVWNLNFLLSYLHQEDILVAVVPQHVVVDLGDDSIPVLPVEIPDIAGVDFVLVFVGRDKSRDGGGDKVQGGVHVLIFMNTKKHGSQIEKTQIFSFLITE